MTDSELREKKEKQVCEFITRIEQENAQLKKIITAGIVTGNLCGKCVNLKHGNCNDCGKYFNKFLEVGR